MANPIRHVIRGQTIQVTATDYNLIATAVNDYLTREAKKMAGRPSMATPRTRRTLVYNATGQTLDRYAVVGVSTVRVTPNQDEASFMSQAVLYGEIPDATKHMGRFAVTLEPVGAGGVVDAKTEGVVQCWVDDDSQGGLLRAEMVHGQTGYLALAGYGSADLVYRPGGPGPELSMVRLGPAPQTFPVTLVQVGGTQGDDENPATWTYAVLDLGNKVLIAEADPVSPPHRCIRAGWGAVNQANAGLATWSGGALILLATNEFWNPNLHLDRLDEIEERLTELEDEQWGDRLDRLDFKQRSGDVGYLERNLTRMLNDQALPLNWPPGQQWADRSGVLTPLQLATRMTWAETKTNVLRVFIGQSAVTWTGSTIDERIEQVEPYVDLLLSHFGLIPYP